MDYLNNISSKTTQLGIAKLIPNELKKSEGLLFIATYLGESYVSSFFSANSSAILSQDVDLNLLPLVLNLTDRKYDVMLVDSRGVAQIQYQSDPNRLAGLIISPVVFPNWSGNSTIWSLKPTFYLHH